MAPSRPSIISLINTMKTDTDEKYAAKRMNSAINKLYSNANKDGVDALDILISNLVSEPADIVRRGLLKADLIRALKKYAEVDDDPGGHDNASKSDSDSESGTEACDKDSDKTLGAGEKKLYEQVQGYIKKAYAINKSKGKSSVSAPNSKPVFDGTSVSNNYLSGLPPFIRPDEQLTELSGLGTKPSWTELKSKTNPASSKKRAAVLSANSDGGNLHASNPNKKAKTNIVEGFGGKYGDGPCHKSTPKEKGKPKISAGFGGQHGGSSLHASKPKKKKKSHKKKKRSKKS